MTNTEIRPQLDNESTINMCLSLTNGNAIRVATHIDIAETHAREAGYLDAQAEAEYADMRRILCERFPFLT